MTDVEQIETAVCSNQLFPSSTQLLAVMSNLVKVDNFWTHAFLSPARKYRLIAIKIAKFPGADKNFDATELWHNVGGWPFTDLSDLGKNGGKKTKPQRANIGGARRLPDFHETGGARCRGGSVT